MDSTARSRILAVTLGLFISLIFVTQNQRRVLAQSADEAAVRALVERYFAAYPAENLEAVIALWGEKSPDLAAAKERLKNIFAASDQFEIRGLQLRRLAVEGESARAIATFEMSAIDAKTGKPAASVGKMNREMGFAKQVGQWRVWSEEPAETQLAARLAAAKTDEERQRLLTEGGEFVGIELREALVTRGTQLALKGDYPRALSIFQLAERVAEQVNDQKGVAIALRGIGTIHSRRGDYAHASEHFQKSVRIFEALDDKAGIAGTLNNIGLLYEQQGEPAQAMQCYERSLKLNRALGAKAGIATTLNNMAIVHQSQGSYAEAIEYHQKALALREALNDKGGISGTLNNLGLLNHTQGNNAQAVEYLQKSLALKEELGDKAGIARTLNNLGLVHHSQGNYTQAMESHRRSLALKESLGDRPGIATSLGNIGREYESQGDYAQAMVFYQKGLELKEALGEKIGMAIDLNNIGLVHQARGDNSQALEFFHKSLTLREAVGDKAGIASSLTHLSNLHYQQGRNGEALKLAARASALARQIGSLDSLWYSELIAGRAFASLAQPDDARRSFINSINTIETMRSQVAGAELEAQRFLENRLEPYLAMAHLLIRENNISEALTYAERAKARVLLDVLQSGRVTVSKAMSVREAEEEQRLRGEMTSLNARLRREGRAQNPDQARIADLSSSLQRARLSYGELQTRLYAAHPELRVKRGEAQLLRLEQIPQLIDPNTALLEYTVTTEAAHLFVVTANANANANSATRHAAAKPVVRVYDLKTKKKDLAARVEALRQRIANNDLEVAARSADLYDLLIKPAAAQLQGKTRLIIVPDDVLWEMPFQALRPTGGRYLIQTAAISYAPSLTVLREMMSARSKRATGSTLLAMGNPQLAGQTVARSRNVLMNASFEPLPEAERLVKSLGRIYGPEASRIFVGAEAREDALKAEAGKHRILQLATHGVLNDASPMYSHVVLSQNDSGKEDGLLEAWEMMNLDLKAELVVLSACETARGRIGAGEGVIGITWALFVAGSPTTVVSQWKVESSSTTELMLEFHRNLRSRASKGEAMRRAAMKLIADRRYAHPFYWAGFIVVGDGN